jgi:membrane protease subunit HflK
MAGKNGGPWGSGGGSGGNSGGNKGGGSGGSPFGGGKPPPDLDEILKRSQEKFKNAFPPGSAGSPKGALIIGMAAFALWLSSGIFRVDTDEQAIIMRFGEYHRIATPGLNYHLPTPIERMEKRKVTKVEKVEVGFRSAGGFVLPGGDQGARPSVLEESLMLTKDENILDINFEVQWQIGNLQDFIFNVRFPEDTVKDAAESAMREVIGRTSTTNISAKRDDITVEAQDLLQKILDSYGSGITIRGLQLLKADPPAEVIDAFRDVQSARADKERAQNEAKAYENDIIPKARGESKQIVAEAEAYRQRVVARAEGEASRFQAVYNEYKEAPEVTRKRIYFETMEEIMEGMDKLIIDDKAGNGVVPYLPLDNMTRKSGEAK